MGSNRRYDVAIVGGCGHIGLPLGIMLAKAGVRVAALDTDARRRELVAAGKMPFLEYGAEELLPEVLGSTFALEQDLEVIRDADVVIVTIGTPVDEYLNPAFRPLFELADELAPLLGADQHLMLRSTVYPGLTRKLYAHLRERGCEVEVSYCPERIVQGYAITELDMLPQIVSGFSEAAVATALALYGKLTERLIVVEVEEAELAKLYLNAWRYIQFSIANQFYMMAEEHGIDFFRVHDAMTTGYARASDLPLPGFTAGPCLFKDTMQLAAFQRGNFQLGHAAMLVNEGLPTFVVEQLQQRLDLKGRTIGVLGMAFKANIDDTRDSLAFKLKKILEFEGATVLCSDAFIDDPAYVSAEELLERSDAVVIGAPHAAYKTLPFPDDLIVVDVWGFRRSSLVPA